MAVKKQIAFASNRSKNNPFKTFYYIDADSIYLSTGFTFHSIWFRIGTDI